MSRNATGKNVSHSPAPAKTGTERARPMRVDNARAAMLSAIGPLAAEAVDLDDALGRVLAGAVTAVRDQPPFAVSAMDGYALRSVDAPGTLRVIGESAAGRGFAGRCEPGGAVRTSTGAAMPQGADTVAIQEDVKREGEVVIVPAVAPGKNIRPRGGDFSADAALLPPGRLLDGVAVSLAAAAGMAVLSVIRRPRIAILCSGDELAAPGTAPGPYQIFDSAAYGVASLVRAWGGVARRLDVARDDPAVIARAAEQGLRNSDLLVVIGGASVGDHDHARPALMRLGLELAVEKVAVRPGKPTWFGVTPHGPVLGLPGNPSSALACSYLFLRPLIEAMLGRDAAACVTFRRAQLTRAMPSNGPREHYLRGFMDVDADGQLTVRSFEDQDSSLISVFAAANALIRMAPDAAALPEGALVDVLPIGGL
ncbi:MAG: molybdopterin molybdotransferase MoeA [Alphaproteobacteria bacterium]|nr:molybdopterin molybdotransferase MoeA [Alphaproteobacteria bacterium]